jgi:hypothetical protein
MSLTKVKRRPRPKIPHKTFRIIDSGTIEGKEIH